MNKTILGLLALLLIGGVLAQTPEVTAKHQASLHWMSKGSEPCTLLVNAFSTRTTMGITGLKSDGTTVCFVPRQRGGCMTPTVDNLARFPNAKFCRN